MNLIALELYRLRIEISTGFKWGWMRPLVGRYLWILGLTFLKVGWVSPRHVTPDLAAEEYVRATIQASRTLPRTRSGRPIIS